MSSYRSYAPWKSSLPTSYKSGSTSAYSSRDDISSRYGSLASPSTYRPSFSGGTYRIKRDPVPSTPTVTPYVSRYASANTAKDPTKSNESSASKTGGTTSKYGAGSSSSTSKDGTQIKRYTNTNSSLTKYGHSREPSPAALERTNRIKSRESSPLARTLRGKSRDPSPAIDTKCKLGYGAGNSYRMSSTPRATSTGYSSRYGSTPTASRASSSSMLDKSISYLSVSDFRARSISRAREISSRKSNEKELEDTIAVESDTIEAKEKEQTEEVKEDSESDSSDEEIFISVSVVTRATSPTLPGSTTVQRTRRMDIAKTIEKTINRSTKKKKMLEKEIQSDRMDDPTRYSRFGLSSRVSSYSPHSEGRYTSSNSLRYSNSPLSTISKSTSHNSEGKKEETPKRSPSTEAKLTKSKLSPPKAVRINSRQSSVENLAATNANKSLPPTAPKADSPTKTATTATVKWPNKDFRKSALNVGPTDRPRKSRTPSTGTESDGTTPLRCRQERSPSACSEGSNTSAGNNKKNAETKVRQRCHPKTGTTLGRQNSSTSMKSNAHKSCHPAATALMSSSTSTCSSSGTESTNENNKTNKPKKTINKKKPANSLNTEVITTNEPKRMTSQSKHAGIVDTNSSKSTTSDKNSSDSQPPAVIANELQANDTEDNTQIPLNKNTTTNQRDRADSSQLKTYSKSSHSPLVNPQKKATCRLQKLSSVSNFFVARQNDTNSEPIFFESSESSTELDTHPTGGNSITKEFETNTSPAKNAIELTFATTTNSAPVKESATDPSALTSEIPTKGTYAHLENSAERSDSNPPCTATSNTKSTSSNSSKSKSKSKSKSSSPSITSDHTASSTNIPATDLQTEAVSTYTSTSTEQEEPSWWQDTSHQINTSSALDCNPKEDMHYRLRHIDSGEVGWWLRNDEDDTLADDDIKTLNQEDEDASEATGRAQSLPIAQVFGDQSVSRDDSSNSANNTKNSWWVSEINDDNDNNNNNHHNAVADVETQKPECEQDKIDSECEEWNIGRKSKQNREANDKLHWWNEPHEDTNVPEPECRYANLSVKQNGSIQLKICRVESGERPWWLGEENQATVEATIKLPSKERGKSPNANGQQLERSPSSKNNLTDETHWWMSGPKKKLFNVKRVDSGEKAWWQQEDERESIKSKSSPVQHVQQVVQTTKLRHSDSGEQAWWLQDNDTQNSPNHRVATPNGRYVPTPHKTADTESDEDDEHEENGDIEVQQIINYNNNNNTSHHFGTYSNSNSNSHLNDSLNYEYVERPPPLGHRASPDGLEDPMRQRKSPYDNIPMTKVHSHQTHLDHKQYQQQQLDSDQARSESRNRQSREKLFISRHKNIDELLGGSCRPLSPLFFECNSFPAAATGRNLFLEEITPDQVRIHDSTPQMPIIQRMERDESDFNATARSAANSAATFAPRMVTPLNPHESVELFPTQYKFKLCDNHALQKLGNISCEQENNRLYNNLLQ